MTERTRFREGQYVSLMDGMNGDIVPVMVLVDFGNQVKILTQEKKMRLVNPVYLKLWEQTRLMDDAREYDEVIQIQEAYNALIRDAGLSKVRK